MYEIPSRLRPHHCNCHNGDFCLKQELINLADPFRNNRKKTVLRTSASHMILCSFTCDRDEHALEPEAALLRVLDIKRAAIQHTTLRRRSDGGTVDRFGSCLHPNLLYVQKLDQEGRVELQRTEERRM